MSERVLDAVKFALLGQVVGSSVAFGADVVFSQVSKLVAPPVQGSASMADNYGRTAFAVVAASGVAGAAMFMGESVMQMAGGGNDPLVGLFFYHTCFDSMGVTRVAPRAIQSVLGSLMAPSRGAAVNQQAGSGKAAQSEAHRQRMNGPGGCKKSGGGCMM